MKNLSNEDGSQNSTFYNGNNSVMLNKTQTPQNEMVQTTQLSNKGLIGFSQNLISTQNPVFIKNNINNYQVQISRNSRNSLLGQQNLTQENLNTSSEYIELQNDVYQEGSYLKTQSKSNERISSSQFRRKIKQYQPLKALVSFQNQEQQQNLKERSCLDVS